MRRHFNRVLKEKLAPADFDIREVFFPGPVSKENYQCARGLSHGAGAAPPR